jgi:hypothetical protein
VLANGQPQPGLRQVCLASFGEATLQHRSTPGMGEAFQSSLAACTMARWSSYFTFC